MEETRRYRVILEPEEGAGFTVIVPALPPVITHGSTREEALQNAADAIRLYLESLKADARADGSWSHHCLPLGPALP